MEQRLREVSWTEKDSKSKELEEKRGTYFGISYQGSFDTQCHTRIMVIREDNGRIAELYPTQLTFIDHANTND